MLSKDIIFKRFFATIAELRKAPPPILLANLRHAGAFIDVRKLIKSGWEQVNGLQKGEEVLVDGSVVLRRKVGGGRRESECRIFISRACEPVPDASGGHASLKDDALVAAYVGTGPYDAYLRWLDFPDAGKSDVNRLVSEIERATITPAGLFEEDFELVVANERYSGRAPLNPHDSQLGALYNVARREIEAGNFAAGRRVYSSVVRALLTDDDPKGRAFISDTEDEGLLGQIMNDLAIAGFPDGARALLGLILLKFWDRMESEFDPQAWLQAASIACWLEEFILAGYLYGRGVPLLKKSEARRDAAFEASRNVLFFLRKFPKDLEELDFASSCLDAVAPDLAVSEEARVLHILMRAWMESCNDGDIADDVFELVQESIAKGCDEFDASLSGDEDALKNVPSSVKAQLSWQTFLALCDGRLKDSIESFPHAPFSDGSKKALSLPTTFVAGLPIWDVWRGFFVNFDGYEFETLFEQLSRRAARAKPGPWATLSYRDQTDFNYIAAQRILHLPKRQLRDLDSMAIEGDFRDSKNGENIQTISCFPYLPKERGANAANCTFGMWEFFPWRSLIAADARVELGNGRQIFATMPYYAYDKGCAMRGQKMSGLLALFPAHVWKSDAAEDSFVQGIYNNLLFRSGVNGCGVVRGVAKTDLEGVPDGLLRFTVDVEGVARGIPLIVNPCHFKGEIPAAGDRIGFEGWAYLDCHDFVETHEDYAAKYPDGREMLPPPPEPDEEDHLAEVEPGPVRRGGAKGGKRRGASGGGSGRKDGIFLIECRIAGTSHVDGIADKMKSVTAGSRLSLRRDRKNAWDSDAIAVFNAEGDRIGYIPQNQNTILSRLMDGGKKLYALVVSKKTEDRYFNVSIGVYMEE